MMLLYKVLIRLYGGAIRLASLWNNKARQWVVGRRGLLERVAAAINGADKVVWIHCASLGEFEQGRPLIEALKTQTDCRVLLTFYSPSGYEIRKDYAAADWVFYLPLDTPRNAVRWLDAVQPRLAVFIKYELWYHFLHQAQKRQIPTFLVSAIFRNKQFFFKKPAQAFLEIIQGFTYIFVQDEASQKLLQKHHIHQVRVAGDTRIDRVVRIAQESASLPVVEKFVQSPSKVLVAGSTWAADESILIPFINQQKHTDWQFVIAPHEIESAHIQKIKAALQVKSICYSEAQKMESIDAKVLIVDNIGLLSKIYRYATLSYIGGGFGKGIHNILEPAVFEIPVIFGPKYQKFAEARILVAQQGAFSIGDADDFKTIFEKLQQATAYQQAVTATKSFIQKNQGATDVVMRYFQRYLDDL